jgi:hypothetical protein
MYALVASVFCSLSLPGMSYTNLLVFCSLSLSDYFSISHTGSVPCAPSHYTLAMRVATSTCSSSECCIGQINRLVGVYLSDAEHHLNGLPCLQQHAITGLHPQCLFFLSLHFYLTDWLCSSNKFNLITKASLVSYGNYLARLFPIVLRFSVLLLGGGGQFNKEEETKAECFLNNLATSSPSSQQSSI